MPLNLHVATVWLHALLMPVVAGIDVTTQLGVVRGYQVSEGGVLLNVFTGIPYAQPPVGNLRFRKPLLFTSWPNPVVDATVLPNSCCQPATGATFAGPNTPISEDCLYLNIWAPNVTSSDSKGRAVMVFIYGGGFYSGSSTLSIYDGRVMAAHGDVIVVSMQYRLGVLGFLYLGTPDVPGNAGVLDQQMALQWVHDHIGAFGGDPSRVTIFGESAGAMSVGLQLLSPLTQGLVQRGIMESGSGASSVSVDTPSVALNKSLTIVAMSPCANLIANLTAVANCLKQMNANNLTMLAFQSSLFRMVLPVVDKYFMPDMPSKLLAQGNINNVSGILLGSNTNEGALIVVQYVSQLAAPNAVASRDQFIQVISGISSPLVQQAVIFQYTEPQSYLGMVSNYRQSLADVLGDYMFVCPAAASSDGYAKLQKSVYRYQFNHRSLSSRLPAWMGVTHTAELEYVFGIPLASWNNVSFTQAERDLALKMVVYWSNFAKTGDPNLGSSQTQVQLDTWPVYTLPTIGAAPESYISLDTNVTYGQYLRAQQCAFWNIYVPQLWAAEMPPMPPTTTAAPPSTTTRKTAPTSGTMSLVTSSSSAPISLLLAAFLLPLPLQTMNL